MHLKRFAIPLLLIAATSWRAFGAGETVSSPVDLEFAAPQLPPGTRDNVVQEGTSLTLAETAVTGRYLSPAIDAPIPFNAIVPQWQATVPEAASFTVEMRTGTATGWDEWHVIHPNADLTPPGTPQTAGEMIFVPGEDGAHQRIQFALNFGRYGGEPAPVLEQIRFTFIDSTDGPTTAELVERQQIRNDANPQRHRPDGTPKPFVISREVWCTEPDCNYSEGLEYHPVSHLIVHHTVTNNANQDWAAVVRAIWEFHTYSRGWGDVGYNYLVDQNGVVYEGHLGGDDVVGTHSAAANTGSLGVALIGTFTAPHDNPPGIAPPEPMLDTLIDLLAWKAAQRDINVFDAGDSLPNVAWGLPHLMGHRDVYGGDNTACPGDQVHVLLPWLRQQVADHIGLTDPYFYVEETSAAFAMSNLGYWFVPPGGCGHSGHAYYTFSVTETTKSTNWGEWTINAPASGRYQIDAYAPYCFTGAAETYGATYDIIHPQGTSRVVVSQEANVGEWFSLGTYDLVAGQPARVHLTDLTTTDTGLGVWFDSLRVRNVDANVDTTPPTSAVTRIYQLTNAYYVTWSGADDVSGIATYHIDYRVAGESLWRRWLTATPATDARFAPPTTTRPIYFRSQATDRAGNEELPHPVADLSTDQAVSLPHVIMLPVVVR